MELAGAVESAESPKNASALIVDAAVEMDQADRRRQAPGLHLYHEPLRTVRPDRRPARLHPRRRPGLRLASIAPVRCSGGGRPGTQTKSGRRLPGRRLPDIGLAATIRGDHRRCSIAAWIHRSSMSRCQLHHRCHVPSSSRLGSGPLGSGSQPSRPLNSARRSAIEGRGPSLVTGSSKVPSGEVRQHLLQGLLVDDICCSPR